jgi:hypothetical protein
MAASEAESAIAAPHQSSAIVDPKVEKYSATVAPNAAGFATIHRAGFEIGDWCKEAQQKGLVGRGERAKREELVEREEEAEREELVEREEEAEREERLGRGEVAQGKELLGRGEVARPEKRLGLGEVARP